MKRTNGARGNQRVSVQSSGDNEIAFDVVSGKSGKSEVRAITCHIFISPKSAAALLTAVAAGKTLTQVLSDIVAEWSGG